jgi:hypothetical protein
VRGEYPSHLPNPVVVTYTPSKDKPPYLDWIVLFTMAKTGATKQATLNYKTRSRGKSFTYRANPSGCCVVLGA